MGTFIQRCLEEADREKWRSIAFPALGTGNLRFPPEVVASLLFKCADEFQSTHLKEVRIILWHGDSAAVKVRVTYCVRSRPLFNNCQVPLALSVVYRT